MQKIPLILTRPAGSNAAFVADFPEPLAAKLEFIDAPLAEIVPLATKVALSAEAAVIFTSSNAIGIAPQARGRRAFCVGQRTTETARAAGWDAVCAGLNAEALVSYLCALRPEGPLVHLSGVHVRGDIVEKLGASGLTATRIVLYDQVLLPLSDEAARVLKKESPVLAPLFSPRTGAHFAAVCPACPQLRIVTMSDAVTESLGNLTAFEVRVACQPTSCAVIECIDKVVAKISLG